MIIDDLTLTESLAKTSFGEIFLTSKKGSSTQYVTNVIEKTSIKGKDAEKYIEREISILKEVNHPNILKLIEVKDKEEKLYIVQEYCNGGNLKKFLEKYYEKNKKGLPEEAVQHIMRQLLSAMDYLSNKEILHRDLKSENILINYEEENDRKNNNIMKAAIKLMDFGFAKHLKKGDLTYTVLGSPLYMSPLLLNRLNEDPLYKDKGYDEKEDVWSIGTICYELLTGRSTFDSKEMDELYQKINVGNYYMPITLSKEAISFLRSMLKFDSNKRLSYGELSNHQFLKKNVNEFHKIELDELKNLPNKDKAQLLVNTKRDETCWIIFQMDPKKIFDL